MRRTNTLSCIAAGVGSPRRTVCTWCAGGAAVRLQIVTADTSGSASTSIDIAAAAGLSGGETKRYQLWYQDVVSPCGAGFNLTNGVEVVWGP